MYSNGRSRISPEEFLDRFPTAVENGHIATRLLREAGESRSAEELECAIVIGFVFGFALEHQDILCRLFEADWHFSHEDIISALDNMRTPDAIETLFLATQWVPSYLDYDDARALAVKAIWALGNLGHDDAIAKLLLIADTSHPILRENARNQLQRQHKRD